MREPFPLQWPEGWKRTRADNRMRSRFGFRSSGQVPFGAARGELLAGDGHTRWRMAIGNLVPPDAAEAIANQILRALLIAALGAFALESTPIWVAPERRAMVV
jgi:hypothetical protein